LIVTRHLFHQPPDGWVGDVIPWQEDGVLSLFYLHEERIEPKPGTPWRVMRTKDLLAYSETEVALSAGAHDAADFNAYTGSVVADEDGTHHLFYTGQNPRILGEDGQPLQVVLHATSDDAMTTWQRHHERPIVAPAGYESADWRDPFVLRDEEAGLWRMLVTARHDNGPQRRRGVIAQLVSQDLVTWEPVEPFWDPRRYVAHECPEVFEWNGWYYLVYSEFSDAFSTRYRMARSLHGPWLEPEHDSLDGRAFYAAKSVEWNGRRLFFGWIASREGDHDEGPWQWAGTLAVLEARQRPDGTLAFGFTDELLGSFTRVLPLDRTELPGALDARGRHRAVVLCDALPDTFHASLRVRIDEHGAECGVLLRTSPDGDVGYIIRLEPRRSRMVFDRWPRRRTGDAQWEISGDVPHVVELERPCDLSPGEHVLDVVVEGDICVVNLDRAVSLSTRLYDFTGGGLGVFVTEGVLQVEDVALRAVPEPQASRGISSDPPPNSAESIASYREKESS
jgi:beta-fructofuranosidase